MFLRMARQQIIIYFNINHIYISIIYISIIIIIIIMVDVLLCGRPWAGHWGACGEWMRNGPVRTELWPVRRTEAHPSFP